MQTRLVIQHIGARGVTQAFPALPAFDADVLNVLVDADASSTDETRQHNDQRTAEVLVISACIAGTDGPRTFHHTNCPYGSSLLQADPAMGDLYVAPHWIDYDYTLNEALSTARAQDIEAITLDTMVNGSAGRIPFADFLSLDAQGSELEILRGAPQSLSAALGIVCEVEFVSLYSGQPMISDVFAFMQAKGFVFCGFFDILRGSYYRAPIGLRGKSIPITTDALFLKRPDAVTEERATRLRKLAFFALINGHLEYALWALSHLGSDEPALSAAPSWHRFVDDFRAIAGRFPDLKLESFDQQKVSPDPAAVRGRFSARAKLAVKSIKAQSEELQALLRRHGLNESADIQGRNFSDILTRFNVS